MEDCKSYSDYDLRAPDVERVLRNVVVVATSDRTTTIVDQRTAPDKNSQDYSSDRATVNKACTHCGS